MNNRSTLQCWYILLLILMVYRFIPSMTIEDTVFMQQVQHKRSFCHYHFDINSSSIQSHGYQCQSCPIDSPVSPVGQGKRSKMDMRMDRVRDRGVKMMSIAAWGVYLHPIPIHIFLATMTFDVSTNIHLKQSNYPTMLNHFLLPNYLMDFLAQ